MHCSIVWRPVLKTQQSVNKEAHLALQPLDAVCQRGQLTPQVLLLLLQVTGIQLCAADRLTQLLHRAAAHAQAGAYAQAQARVYLREG